MPRSAQNIADSKLGSTVGKLTKHEDEKVRSWAAMVNDAWSKTAAKNEQAMQEQLLWEKALRMLRCHQDGVPTLLGLCVVAVTQEYAHAKELLARPAADQARAAFRAAGGGGDKLTASKRATVEKAAGARQRAHKLEQGVEFRLPQGLREYIIRLKGWVLPKLQEQQLEQQRRPSKSSGYGACPKTPHAHGLTWVEAKDALQRMKLLDGKLAVHSEADRSNINKFLNRLLGLPVHLQVRSSPAPLRSARASPRFHRPSFCLLRASADLRPASTSRH